MDKYPYFADKICINSTKTLIFVHFFILAQQSSLHNGEGETVYFSSSFPCFLEEDWQLKCNIFYLDLSSSTNLVIFVKVIFVIFDFENDKNDFDKNDTLSLLRLLILYGFVTA